jgi:hypothetical protein
VWLLAFTYAMKESSHPLYSRTAFAPATDGPFRSSL